ncbi:MAG: hypothetical protein Q9159_004255 [Coniocarpon cinnabarinum]
MTDVEREPLLGEARPRHHGERPGSSGRAQRTFEETIAPETAVVGRQLGWTSTYILVISRVIGSGLFAMPGTILQTVGSPGIALVLWAIGFLVAWAGLAINMEYGCMLPRSGGIEVYLEYTYRRPRLFTSIMVAVQAVLLGFTASNCIVFAKYTIYAFRSEGTDARIKTLAVGLLTFITVMHGCFYKVGIWIQNTLGWIKLALVAFIVLSGLAVLLYSTTSDQTDNHQPSWLSDPFRDSDFAWNNLATSFFKVIYSYAGLNNAHNVLNEVKNPVHTLKSVAPVALLTVGFTYLLVNVAYFEVVPLQEAKQSRELIAALFFERILGTTLGGMVLPLAITVSAAGNVMVVTFSLARLNQEVAREGFLPYADLLASSKPFGAPLGGLVLHYVPSLLVIVLPPSSTVYAFIADVEGYAAQFYFLAVAIGLLLIAISSALLAAPFFPSKNGHSDVNFFYAAYALVAVAVLLIGVVWWLFIAKLIPRWKGFVHADETDVLDDGTTVTRLVRKGV